MRLFYDGFLKDTASLGSPGIDELRWLKPVRPGDTLTARAHRDRGDRLAQQARPGDHPLGDGDEESAGRGGHDHLGRELFSHRPV